MMIELKNDGKPITLRLKSITHKKGERMIRDHMIRATTTCTLSGPGSRLLTVSSSCSWNDRFDEFQGMKRAITRALDVSGLKKETRAKIWAMFFARIEGSGATPTMNGMAIV